MNPSIRTAHAAQVLPARAFLFLGIVAFHVLLAYLFASGMMVQVTKILLPRDIEVIKLPDKPATPVEAPAAPPPQLITAFVPPVDNDLPVINTEPDSGAITAYTEPPAQTQPTAPPAPTPPPIRLVGRNVMPNTADYYPPQDVREGNEGTAEVRSCVNPAGKLDGTPTVEATSGRASLDKAAVRLARDGKYARAMRGDTPVPNCYRFRVTFTMHDQ